MADKSMKEAGEEVGTKYCWKKKNNCVLTKFESIVN